MNIVSFLHEDKPVMFPRFLSFFNYVIFVMCVKGNCGVNERKWRQSDSATVSMRIGESQSRLRSGLKHAQVPMITGAFRASVTDRAGVCVCVWHSWCGSGQSSESSSFIQSMVVIQKCERRRDVTSKAAGPGDVTGVRDDQTVILLLLMKRYNALLQYGIMTAFIVHTLSHTHTHI